MKLLSATVLENTAAMFALILAAGFVAGKAKLLSKASQNGMTNLVLYVTLPCTIVNSFRVDYDPSLLHGLVMALLAAGISQAIGQTMSVVFFRRQPFERRSVFRYGMIVTNSGFFGISVISALVPYDFQRVDYQFFGIIGVFAYSRRYENAVAAFVRRREGHVRYFFGIVGISALIF